MSYGVGQCRTELWVQIRLYCLVQFRWLAHLTRSLTYHHQHTLQLEPIEHRTSAMAAQQLFPTPFELVERVKQALERSPNQAKLDKFRVVLRGYASQLDNHEEPDMRNLLRLFGGFFFDGTLQGVAILWDDRLLRGEMNEFGCTRENDSGTTEIRLDPRPFFGSGREESLFGNEANSIFTTMLHEACHAYLRTESGLIKACGDDRCREVYGEQVGKGGHGDAFLRVASLVEKFAKTHDLWRCDLELKVQAQAYEDEADIAITSDTVRFCWPGLRLQRVGRKLEFY